MINMPPEPTGWDMMLEFEHKRITHRFTMAALLEAIADHANVEPHDLKKPKVPVKGWRRRCFSWPRAAFCSMAHNAGFSHEQIGMFLGGLDHTTIMHGVKHHRIRLAEGRVDALGAPLSLAETI